MQTEDTGQTAATDKRIDPEEPEPLEDSGDSGTEEDTEILEQLHENLSVQIAGLGMREDEDHNVDPEQSKAEDNSEALTQEEEHVEKVESSQEGLEVEETICLEQQECDQRTSQDREVSPEHSESEQVETTEDPEQMLAEVSHETEEQLGQSTPLDQSPEMEMGNQSTQPQNAEEPEDYAEIVCDGAEDPGVTMPQEQMEPSGLNEESLQTTSATQTQTLSEREMASESEIKEQLSPETEVTQQTEEPDVHQVDNQADASDHAEDFVVTDSEAAQRVVANGEQHKAPDTATSYINGEVDKGKACCLAERLFKLDGIQRANVVKHLDKE